MLLPPVNTVHYSVIQVVWIQSQLKIQLTVHSRFSKFSTNLPIIHFKEYK